MDLDGDGHLGVQDLISFADLMHEDMDCTQAFAILRDYGVEQNGLLAFDGFWEWYRAQHGMHGSEDEDVLSD
jgi:Ca2+-binding EF-hand superfamily protein